MEGKSESHCPRVNRGSIRLNRWKDPLRRLCAYLANHRKAGASKLGNRPWRPTEGVEEPLCGGKLKSQPLVHGDDSLPSQKQRIEEADVVETRELRADLKNLGASTSVCKGTGTSCTSKCHVVHRYEKLEDSRLKACRFENEVQLPQYETSKELATIGQRSDRYGRASLEEKLQKPQAAGGIVHGTKTFGGACTEQNSPQLKKPPVPTSTIFKTSREGQLGKPYASTLTVYKRSDKYGRGSLENIERTEICDQESAKKRALNGERTRTPILSVFKRSDRLGRASLEEKVHRCMKSPAPEGRTGRLHQASKEEEISQVQKPRPSAFTIFKRSDGHGNVSMEENAYRCQELRLPENSVHGTDRYCRARPDEGQIVPQEKPRELTSSVFNRSDKNGRASVEEKVNQLKKSSVSVKRADKQILQLVKPSPSATASRKPCLRETVPHSGNECTGKTMPQLVKLRAPTAVFSLSNRCGRARLEEQGPELLKTNRFRQTCKEQKPQQSEDSSKTCCTSQEQCVHTMKREECASTTKQDNASKRLKASKKQRRLWRRKRNQIVPLLTTPTKPQGDKLDACASLTETSNIKSFLTECMRKGHKNEAARNKRTSPRAGTATMSGEPNKLERLQAPKVSNRAKGDKRLLPRTKFTRRLFQSIPKKDSQPAVPCSNQVHQRIHAPYSRTIEPGKIAEIPLSVTGGTRQLSCRVYRPEDFEEVFAHGEQVELGEGSFGNVALVMMRSTDRPLIAVKSFHRSHVRARDIFREVEAMEEAQDHWAFPKLHGVIKDRQVLSIALEFIGDSTTLMGQTVQNAIRHKKKMKVKHNWIGIGRDIALGLNHLHGKGFLHCDFKSNNALLWHDHGVWRAKIIDLGKACRIENARGPMRLTVPEQQENFARFPHLPHEVIVGQDGYTVEGDIYSLGYVFRQISTVCSYKHRMIDLATRCYDVEPSLRPTLPSIITDLTSLCGHGQHWWVT